MFCVRLLHSFFLSLVLTSLAIAHTHPRQVPPPSAPWTDGYTMVLVDADSPEELAAARNFITSQGGTVAVTLPPHTIFGWIPPAVGDKIIGRFKIRSIHRRPVEVVPARFNDRVTRAAINSFNDIASGRASRDLNKARPGADALQPMTECALPKPPINRDEFMHTLRSMGGYEAAASIQSGVRPQMWNNSDIMDGKVAVAVFLAESNGGIDINSHSWTQADQDLAFAKILEGLTWWVDQSRAFNLARPLQFTIVPYRAENPACQIPYEPIVHQGSEANTWVNHIMKNLGASSNDVFTNVAAFNRSVKEQQQADWAFSIFIAYNPSPTQTSFPDGRASWAYLGGPHTVMLFRSYGWALNQITSHEVGHIFFACDEYSLPNAQSCSCSCAPEVRPQATNENCQDSTCRGANSVPCMMRVNETSLCSFTVAQIGWISSVPRPVPTAPASLVASSSGPTQVNLVWQDTSTSEDGFQIERRGGSDGEFAQIAVVQEDATGYNDTSVQPNTAYAYRVRAFNTSGASDYTPPAVITTPSTPSNLSITSVGLSDATVGVSYSQTVVASGGRPDYTWTIESGTIPTGLVLSQSGTISGVPSTAGTNNLVVRVTDADNRTASKALTLVVKASAPLTITTGTLPRGTVGSPYSQNLGASGGQTPYTWVIQSGSLPDGLILNQAGTITGTPDRAGTSSFVIRLTDATNASKTGTFSITINPAIVALAVETVSLEDGVVGQKYSQTLKAIGGNAPYTWVIKSGSLPAGLVLSADGIISGQPTTSGESEFEVQVFDQGQQQASQLLSIDVDPAPQLTILNQSQLPLAAVGIAYRAEFKATAGTAPYNWSKKKKKKFGQFPDGMTLSADGMLSGTPTATGISTFTLTVRDGSGKVATKPFSIEVGPPPPPLEIRTTFLPNAQQNIAYAAAVEAAGGLGPYTWSVDVGTLPDGLTLNSNGQITGKATTLGSATFTVRVRDSVGTSSTRQLSITVLPPPPPLVIQTVSLPETSAERPYLQTLQATGGVPPYSWGLASGSLGAGLNLSADGVISGIPMTPGVSVFSVRVTDSAQQTVTRTLAINIKPADKVAPFGALETPGSRATLNNQAFGTGWALDNVGVTAVEVLVDGQKVAEAIYGTARPDIAVAWGNFPNGANAGFNFTFDTSKLANGDHTLSVRLLDAAGNATTLGNISVSVQRQVLAILTRELPRGRKGEGYNTQFQATNGKAPYTWSMESGALPQGLSLNTAGIIAGTPAVYGSFTFSARVTDAGGQTAVGTFNLFVNPDVPPLLVLSKGELPSGKVGDSYDQQLLYQGGKQPGTWSVGSGTLPPGLSLGPTTGKITGTPTLPGTFNFAARVTDADHATALSETLTIVVAPGPLAIISAGALTAATVGADYSHQLVGSGGVTPYTWSLASGQLPAGLSLSASTGIISGKPTAAGTSTFTIKMTDSRSLNVTSGTLTIVVSAPAAALLSPLPLPFDFGAERIALSFNWNQESQRRPRIRRPVI